MSAKSAASSSAGARAVIVLDVRRREPERREDRADLFACADDVGRAGLGRGLVKIIAVQKIHHVGKGRRRDVVQKRARALCRVGGMAPDDQRRAEAVLVPGIARERAEAREGRVFAAAVHPHVLQSPHRRRFGKAQEERRRLCVIDSVIVHRFPSSQKATALAAATLRESTPCAIGIMTV